MSRYSLSRPALSRPATAVLAAVLVLACPGPDPQESVDYLHVRTWPTPKSVEEFPEHSLPWLQGRPSFGIAFSGGGTRSASATLGQLRALHRLGWLEKARFLTANSGGSWTTVPFTYLSKSRSDEEFLGEYVAPGDFHEDMLEEAEDNPRTMASAIYHARIADLNNLGRTKSLAKGDESYSDLVGRIFLKPFDLHERHKFFTLRTDTLNEILQANRALKEDDFLVMDKERPFLIVAGTLLARQTDAAAEERYLFEATPLYSGTRAEDTVSIFERGQSKEILLGGGYVQSFGYDTYAPSEPAKNGFWKVRLKGRIGVGDLPVTSRYRFSISDMIGMSSAAPLVRFTDSKVPNAFFPEFRHWAVNRGKITKESGLEDGAGDFQHGDGGDTDNLALLPLLARGVENILVFVNTTTRFPDDANCNAVDKETMVDDVISFFRPIGKLEYNQVFAEGYLSQLCEGFAVQKQAKQPLIYCQQYSVEANSAAATRYSMPTYEPNICWAYLDVPQTWNDLLPESPGELEELKKGIGSFDDFPHYRTFGEHGIGMIDLDRKRVHALSNLTAWSVLQGASDIAAALQSADLPLAGGVRE